jgi:hypothetical protein
MATQSRSFIPPKDETSAGGYLPPGSTQGLLQVSFRTQFGQTPEQPPKPAWLSRPTARRLRAVVSTRRQGDRLGYPRCRGRQAVDELLG